MKQFTQSNQLWPVDKAIQLATDEDSYLAIESLTQLYDGNSPPCTQVGIVEFLNDLYLEVRR